jgi:integrase
MDMPRPRPPFLHRQRTQHGRVVWYVRKRPGPRIRIHAAFGTPEFDAEYRAAVIGQSARPHSSAKSATGSLSWLWERYRETGAWTALSPATRKARENIMLRVLKAGGDAQCGAVSRGDIAKARDARAETPAQARSFLDTMRGLFRWALEGGHVQSDPTVGVKNPRETKGAGFPIWTEADIDAYQAYWAVGTKERVWLDVLLYTGLRRGDAVTLGRQHVRNNIATLRTEKSQRTITVSLPILPILAKTLAAGPTAELAFICGANKKPLTKETFGNVFRDACNKAGVTGKSAHGVRKAGATRAADNGATVHELEAIFGWSGGGMAALYTRTADRKRASQRAMSMMERTTEEHPMPSPDQKVRAPARNAE